MSIIDKAIAAVTPPESEDARREARQRALTLAAGRNDWIGMVLDHHQQIEAAFAAVRDAADERQRMRAQRELAIVLSGHAAAEEAVIYPAMANADEKAHATMAYTEHSAAKLQLGLLESLPPMSQDYVDKLEHIRGAVAHHMYEEEGTWLPELFDKLPTDAQERLTRRFAEEFSRHTGGEGALEADAPGLGARVGVTDGGGSLGAPGYQN